VTAVTASGVTEGYLAERGFDQSPRRRVATDRPAARARSAPGRRFPV